ncbi:MAG TPA: ArsA-related P-loop ATPase [Dehalococcoidia bacterium]|nr:ArsA-related P-loop ATPase [Dehalococcoidia bacterium]
MFTGRGGSGVSTVAGATAVALAAGGTRTLVFGLGSGLGDALRVALTHEVSEAATDLFALETRHGQDEPDEFRDWLEDMLDWRGVDVDLAEDLAALPGASQIGRMLNLAWHVENGGYDAVVVDGLPLELFLDLPPSLDAAAHWLDKLFAPRQSNVFEPFVRVFAAEYASAGEELLETGRELLGRLADLREILTGPATSSVRIVLRADDTAGADAREAITALSLFSYASDALIFNRMLPEVVTDRFFDAARSEQKKAEVEARSVGGAMPVLTAALTAKAPRGIEALRALAGDLYGEHAPEEMLHEAATHTFSQQDGGYVMSLSLPFADKAQLAIEQMEDGIAVHLNGRRCVLTLPAEVRYREASSWSFEPPTLKVVFKR